eukprot:6456429-Amphidinium_carterae.1
MGDRSEWGLRSERQARSVQCLSDTCVNRWLEERVLNRVPFCSCTYGVHKKRPVAHECKAADHARGKIWKLGMCLLVVLPSEIRSVL